MIKAEIISGIQEAGKDVIKMKITFPKYLLPELRDYEFMGKCESHEFISLEKVSDAVLNKPFIPISFEEKGFSGMPIKYITDPDRLAKVKHQWLQASIEAVSKATELGLLKVSYSFSNMLLEPFLWHTVVISIKDLKAFFDTYCPNYRNLVHTKGRSFKSKKDYIRYYEQHNDLSTADSEYWHAINRNNIDIHMLELAEVMWDAMNTIIH